MRYSLKFILFRVFLAFSLLGVANSDSRAAQEHGHHTPLDDYVAKKDSAYSWRIIQTTRADDYTLFAIELISQTWRSTKEVDQPKWKHWIKVVRPKVVSSETGLLFVGGSNQDSQPLGPKDFLLDLATRTHTVVAELFDVPNQPLVFADGKRPMSEDDLIAFTWKKYLQTKDQEWPAILPMVKSVVRSMDALQEVAVTTEFGPVGLKKFVLAGKSKRAKTVWNTAAVDPRVVAVAPLVYDVLNIPKNMRNHFESYGFWAPAIGDYVRAGIAGKEGNPKFLKLLNIEDPYSYRVRFTMPKLVLNAAGDEYFTPDSSRFYYDDLPDEKILRYVPNADHSLEGTDAFETFACFYESMVRGLKRPKYSWKFLDDGSIRIETSDSPKEVKLWRAYNPIARDFRIEKVGPIYESVPLRALDGNIFIGKIEPVEQGFTAFFVELAYDIGAQYPLKVTTAVRILPDVLPFQDKNESLPKAKIRVLKKP